MRNNNPGGDAIIAVQEERARIGGVEVARQTLIAATDEGLVFEIDNNANNITKSFDRWKNSFCSYLIHFWTKHASIFHSATVGDNQIFEA